MSEVWNHGVTARLKGQRQIAGSVVTGLPHDHDPITVTAPYFYITKRGLFIQPRVHWRFSCSRAAPCFTCQRISMRVPKQDQRLKLHKNKVGVSSTSSFQFVSHLSICQFHASWHLSHCEYPPRGPSLAHILHSRGLLQLVEAGVVTFSRSANEAGSNK